MNRKLIPFLLLAGALLSSCGSSRDEDITTSTTQPSTPATPTTPSKPSDEQIGRRTYAQEWKAGVDY